MLYASLAEKFERVKEEKETLGRESNYLDRSMWIFYSGDIGGVLGGVFGGGHDHGMQGHNVNCPCNKKKRRGSE